MLNIASLKEINALLTNKISESSILEYKSQIGQNNHEIAKDISAFANTVEGTIIYGIEDKDSFAVNVNWIESQGVGERIENIISSNIDPSLEDYKIIPIMNPDDNTSCIIVLQIPFSYKGPHMVKGKYYKRYNLKSEPMTDNEVRYLMAKNSMIYFMIPKEVDDNFNKIQEMFKIISRVQQTRTQDRHHLIFTPLKVRAWEVFISSGFASSSHPDITTLIQLYNQIDELNHLIYLNNTQGNVGKQLAGHHKRADEATWLPKLIQDCAVDILRIHNRLSFTD